MFTTFAHCLPWSFANWTNGFSLEFLPIEVILFPQGKTLSRAGVAWLKVFGGLGSCSLANGAGSLPRELSFYGSAVVDISDRDWYGKFKSRWLPLIARVFWISFVDAGHFFDGSEDIFAVSLVLLPFLVVAESVIGFLEEFELLIFFFLIFESFNLSQLELVGLLNFLGRSRNFKSLIVQWIPK